MEQIDLSRNLSVNRPSSPNIKKTVLPADKKTAEVALRILRFDDNVLHSQTFGKVMEDGSYKVITQESLLNLVDEEGDEEGSFTKHELIGLEEEFNALIYKENRGLPIDPKELAIIPKAKTFFSRLEQLFDGRDTLPFSLAKPGIHVPERMNRVNSAGVITGTFGFSTISNQDEEGSWQTEPKLLPVLNNLHDKALVEFSAENKLPTEKELLKKMMALREIDRKETLTVDELCAIYLTNCRAKERMMTQDIKTLVEALTNVEDKQLLVDQFHALNWIPINEVFESFDQKFLKDNLTGMLDVEFDKDNLEAKYSSVTERDIREFINKKYLV